MLLGLANTILPFIIFSANYLIIPYPRWTVILIETLPALLIKLALPHHLHYIPYWTRALSVGSCWILAALIASVTPPNVAPPLRILTTVLASAAAAATDVTALGMLRYYGRMGLGGWAAGTGAGGVYVVVMPFVFTVWRGEVVRDSLDFVYCLTAMVLLAVFLILPRVPMNFPITKQISAKGDLEESPEVMRLVARESIRELSLQLNGAKRVELVRRMVQPYMVPLMVTMMARAIIFPGIARALPKSPAFQTFFAFSTSYGLVFQMGNFVGRSLAPLFRVRSTTLLFTVLSAATAAMLVNAAFTLSSSVILVGLVALCGGIMSGALYTIIVGRVVGDKAVESGVEKEFCLQVVGAGETSGLVVGGVLAAVLEGGICRVGSGDGGRWCSSTR